LSARGRASRRREKSETHLDLRTSDPTDSREVVLHQKMVGLVVESPLADDKIGSGVLDPEKGEQRDEGRDQLGLTLFPPITLQ
jgi:hypothetical protein